MNGIDIAKSLQDDAIPIERTFNENYSRAMNLFPYDQPNQHQNQIISRILQLKDKGALLLEAPTGSGKTIASLSSLLVRRNDGERIMVIVRNVSQTEPIIREWGRIVGGFEGYKKGITNRTPGMDANLIRGFLAMNLHVIAPICYQSRSSSRTVTKLLDLPMLV